MERNMNEYSDEEILQCLKYAVYGEEMGAEIIKNSSETIFVIIGFIIAFASSAANIRIITMMESQFSHMVEERSAPGLKNAEK